MHTLLALFIVAVCLVCLADAFTFVPPSDPNLQFQGRYKILDASTGVKSFDAPGFTIRVGVSGASSVDVTLSCGGIDRPNVFWVYVNGTRVTDKLIDTTGLSVGVAQKFNIAQGLDINALHEITLLKVTESDFNNPEPTVNYLNFHGFDLDSGSASRLPSGPSRKIEFIGDSITAGYCNMCPSDNKAHYSDESFALSWPTLVGNALNASIHTSAWSGLGMVRNCCGGSTYMPEIFSRSLMTVDSPDWPFQTADWVPDAVVINLGTNDNLNPTTPTDVERAYEETYVKLVQNISMSYTRGDKSPSFFLACGPMSSNYCPYLFNVINTLNKISPSISTTFVDMRSGMQGTPICCGHPSAESDKKLADITTASIASVLKW